jgi:hypothetical protein
MKAVLVLFAVVIVALVNAQTAYFSQATLDFPSISAASCQELTMTATGAAKGATPVYCDSSANLPSNTALFAFMSATNTITVRVCNVQTIGSINPASMDFFCAAIHYEP